MEEGVSRDDLWTLVARYTIKSQVLGDWFFAHSFSHRFVYHANSVWQFKNVRVVSTIEQGERYLVGSPGAQAVVAVEQFLAIHGEFVKIVILLSHWIENSNLHTFDQPSWPQLTPVVD